MTRSEKAQVIGLASKQADKLNCKKLETAMNLLLCEESGCVIWKLVNHVNGYNYGIVFGFTEIDDDEYELRIKIARQSEDSILMFDYDRDWEYPLYKDGTPIQFEWDKDDIEQDMSGVIDLLKNSVLDFFLELFDNED